MDLGLLKNFLVGNVWLIPILPLIGFVLNGLLALKNGPKTIPFGGGEEHARYPGSKALVSWIGCGTVFLSFLISAYILSYLLSLPVEERAFTDFLLPWVDIGGFKADFAFHIDPLSTVMILVVSGVGFLIHFYSIGYMGHDICYAKYFSFLNLFTAMMLTLVLGDNLLLMFVGWEGVGLCSYLLIGFWYKDDEKASAGKKAFIVNRIGDFGFILGIFLAYVSFGTINIAELSHNVPLLGHSVQGTVTIITLLLFVGAIGKSAQIPLYVWLPDAMAGPTPVSALIHAATMVTAGVFMIGRLSPLYQMAPISLTVVACVGCLTAIFSATIGLAQNDIKKILAYSTVSQLGYMFLAMGVGAYTAGIFHLMTHAFFKACLFLCSGSVIHALSGEQDIQNMGGLRKKIPWTYWTFVISSLAIAGFPGMSGFFSKDEILWKAYSQPNEVIHWLPYVLWAVGAFAALLTAFYMFRLIFVTFHGVSRMDKHVEEHVHESPWTMVLPLVLLAALSIGGGWIGVPEVLHGSNHFHHFLSPAFGEIATHGAHLGGNPHGAHSVALELGLMSVSIVIALFGILIAAVFYVFRKDLPQIFVSKIKAAYRVVFNKYYVDELYDLLVVRPFVWISREFMWKVFDVKGIDGTVNGTASTASGTSGVLKTVQNGIINRYALVFVVGVIAILAYLIVML